MHTYRPRRQRRHLLGLLLLAFACLLGALHAHAQTEPQLTFTPELTRASETLTPKFTWSTTPTATGCVASGDDPNWQGNKAASGSVTLPAINVTKTYGFVCSFAGQADVNASLTWQAPTTYTNGAPLTIAKYTIAFGKNQADVGVATESVPVPGVQIRQHAFPTSTSMNVSNVTSLAGLGAYYFCLRVHDAAGNFSGCPRNTDGSLASKTFVAASPTNVTRSVTLTVDPKPSTASGFTVE